MRQAQFGLANLNVSLAKKFIIRTRVMIEKGLKNSKYRNLGRHIEIRLLKKLDVNILYSTGFDPIGGLVDLVESFLDGGFSGLLALLIFVSFAG
jgi:hypothetical protein